MEFLKWFSDNWLLALAAIIIIGAVIEGILEAIFKRK